MSTTPSGRTLARILNARAHELQAEANLESSHLAARRFEDAVARRDHVKNLLINARSRREVEVFEVARILQSSTPQPHHQNKEPRP